MSEAVDIRARVYCSLGPVISGSVSDTYAQGAGLIYTRGSVEIAAIINPSPGSVVSIAYYQDGYLSRVPRNLVVLSSFADPFRRKTTVQLGCRLSFLQNRSAPPKEKADSKEEFGDVPCEVYRKATLGVSAGFVAGKILAALGLSGAPPLSSHFSVEEFEITGAYLSVLDGLMASEGYVGFMSSGGNFTYKNLNSLGGGGPVIRQPTLIDVGPIGVGDLPAESVLVRYSTKRLKEPPEEEGEDDEETADEIARRNWDYEEVIGADTEVRISYTEENDDGTTAEIVVIEEYKPYSLVLTLYDEWDRAHKRFSLEISALAEVNNRYSTDSYRYFGGASLVPLREEIPKLAVTIWKYAIPAINPPKEFTFPDFAFSVFYNQAKKQVSDPTFIDGDKTAAECLEESSPRPDGYEEVLEEITTTYITEPELAATLNVDTYTFFPFSNSDTIWTFSLPGSTSFTTIVESIVKVRYDKDRSSGITQTVTEKKILYSKTTTGQQDLAALVKRKQELEEPAEFDIRDWYGAVSTEAKRLRANGAEVRIRTEREFGLQRRPSQAERNNTANAIDSAEDPTESVAEFVWSSGSESSSFIDLTLPYAPDDKISWSPSTGYSSTRSNARQVALNYGRIQNRLLLGNRRGVNIQIPASLMPYRPLDPLYIEAQGIFGAYLANGTTYTFDANGIIASADCLAVGGVA